MTNFCGPGSPAQLGAWAKAAASAFDVVICPTDALPPDTEVFDEARTAATWEEACGEQLGSIPADAAIGATERLAFAVAHRLAKAHARPLGLPLEGLRAAWFYPLYAEITTLRPLRHVAAHIAEHTRGRLIAVRLKRREFTALNGWQENEIEPIYLAMALRQIGAAVVLHIDAVEAGRDPIRLGFNVSGQWLSKGYPCVFHDKGMEKVACRTMLRRPKFILEQTGARRRKRPGLLAPSPDFPFFRPRKPERLELTLTPAGGFGTTRLFSAPADTPSLEQAFIRLLGPLTQAVSRWMRGVLDGHDGLTAHLSDHASFEGGIIAAEVLRRNGTLHLWPHSANAVQTFLFPPDHVARITVATRSTGAFWARRFHRTKIDVDFRTIMPPALSAPAFDSGKPLNVILFAGAHALQRTPILGQRLHRERWAQVLTVLQGMDVVLTLKHKVTWETREWISNLSPAPDRLRFTDIHASRLALPNMVFLAISLPSTALLEGMARGVPGLIIRDEVPEETPFYDPEAVPSLSPQALGDTIAGLTSRPAWEALRDRQRTWLAGEMAPL